MKKICKACGRKTEVYQLQLCKSCLKPSIKRSAATINNITPLKKKQEMILPNDYPRTVA